MNQRLLENQNKEFNSIVMSAYFSIFFCSAKKMDREGTSKKLMRVGSNDPVFMTTLKAGQLVRNHKLTLQQTALTLTCVVLLIS